MTVILKVCAILTLMDLLDSVLVTAWFFLVGHGG
jgi:hypothetical protein